MNTKYVIGIYIIKLQFDNKTFYIKFYCKTCTLIIRFIVYCTP